MAYFTRLAVLIAALVSLCACDANFYSIFRTTPHSPGKLHSQLVVTDAKQAISVMQVDPKDGLLRTCAARSPDVFTALSQAFSGSASADVAGKFAGALSGAGTSSESASAFGLRTQLTQSQMELLYQLCIASLNKTISPDQLATELHRYQNTMVSMLAIEQVTGYAKPTIVAIGGQSAAGSADALAKQQERVDGAKSKEADLKKPAAASESDLTTKKAATATAQKNFDDAKAAGKTAAELKPLQDALDKATGEQTQAQTKRDSDANALASQTNFRTAQEGLLAKMQEQINISSGSIPATINSPTPSVVYADKDSAAAVAGAVVALQQGQLNQTFVADECVRFMFHPEVYSGVSVDRQAYLLGVCKTHLEEIDKYRMTLAFLRYGCDQDGKNCKLMSSGWRTTCDKDGKNCKYEADVTAPTPAPSLGGSFDPVSPPASPSFSAPFVLSPLGPPPGPT